MSTPRPVKSVGALLVVEVGLDAGKLKFLLVLTRQTLVGREQDDAVKLLPLPGLAEVVQILADVTVHKQRLAAARGHPEGDLVQVTFGKRSTCWRLLTSRLNVSTA